MDRPTHQRGFSLIEVLVALIVFSVGLLGLALLQIKGAQFTRQAGVRSQAIVLTRSLVDAMRANPIAAAGPRQAGNPAEPSATECPYCLDGGAAPVASGCTAACTPQQVARDDLARWYQALHEALPTPTSAPMARVAWLPEAGLYEVTTRWSDGASVRAAGDDELSYALVYLP